MGFYICRNKTNGDLWSNEFGWVDNSTYDVFMSHEVNGFSLPIGGEWVYLDWLA